MSDLSGVEWLAGFGHSPLRHSPLGPLPCYAYGEHSYLNNNTNGENNNTSGDSNTNVDNNNKTKKYDVKSKEGKPACSYASLIRLAISSKPNGKMTLSELYAYIEQTFPYFQDAGLGWRNSIRHNLSLNKCFVKVARGNDDPGKGSYWTMDLNHQDDQPTKKRKRAIRTSPYSPECSSNSSGDQARSAESASVHSSTAAEVKSVIQEELIKEEFEGGAEVKEERLEEEEGAGAGAGPAPRGGEPEVLSVLELMEDEYDVDSNSGCGSTVRARARRHVCGAERHAAYTDDYGNFIERVVDDCDCPEATDDNEHTDHAPSHDITPSTSTSSYGSFSSSSDLCSPLHSEVGFFDKDLPTTPDTYREFTYEPRAHADRAYVNCQNYAQPPYAQDSHVYAYWGPQIL